MDDGHPPDPPADDAFLAGLRELDEGLDPENVALPETTDRRAPDGTRRPATTHAAASPIDTLDFLNDSVFDHDAAPASEPAAPRPRPLLDLFAPARPDGERKPAAMADTLPSPHSLGPGETRPPPIAPPYGAFYDLRQTPFGLSSDPRFFYASASHAHVLNAVLEAIHTAEGLIVLTAPEGVGKTTICRMAERDLDRRTLVALVVEPPQTIEQLLQTVLVDFGVVSVDLAGAAHLQLDALTSTLASFLKSLVSLRANAVIVIDEAQSVPVGVLRAAADLIAGLELPRQLQVVLAGEPALTSIVKRAGVRAPTGRTGIHVELRPLDDEEIAPYVRHRLRTADSRARVDFSPAAIGRLYLASRGVPREVNRLCERALVDGASRGANVIDAALVDRAAQELGLQVPGAQARPAVRRAVMAVAVLALVLVGTAVASWVFRGLLAPSFQQWLEIPPAPPAAAPELPERIRPLPLPGPAPASPDNVPARPRV